jgi:hypothetical protein
MGLGSIVRTASSAAARTVDVALSLPRIAVALERLASTAESLEGLVDAAPAIQSIGALAEDARRLLGDPQRADDVMAAIAAISRIGDLSTALGPLGDAVRQLNAAAGALMTTVSPLQGASERIGRFVDRLPTKPRPAIDIDAERF